MDFESIVRISAFGHNQSDVTAFNTRYPPPALPVRRSRPPTACQPLPPAASYHNHSITNFSAINEDLS
jgi:hypothetical protein